MSRNERSGWRDLAFSEHHRLWGFDAPMVDIDFLVIEYDRAEPVALISYKAWNASPESACNAAAFKRLAERAGLPAFEVRYSADFQHYDIRPLTNLSILLCLHLSGYTVTEREYVSFLYTLRGRLPPAEIINNLV